MSTLDQTPNITIDQATELARSTFGRASILDCKPLPSERDQNFRIECTEATYILKVANGGEKKEVLEAQNALMTHVQPSQICPTAIPSDNGNLIEIYRNDGRDHFVRLVSYVAGQPLQTISNRSIALLQSLGTTLGKLSAQLQNFDHPAFHYSFHWDLKNGLDVVQKYLTLVQDPEVHGRIESLLNKINEYSKPHFSTLRQSVVHNDANDGNVIVSADRNQRLPGQSVAGLIDLGDAVHTWTVSEIAIGMAYSVLNSATPLNDMQKMVRAYHAEHPLEEDEVNSLFGLVCLRLCVSACLAAKQIEERPDDEYLLVSQEPIKRTLPLLDEIPFALASATFRQACGFPTTQSSDDVRQWLASHSDQFEFVLKHDHQNENLVGVDWSVTSSLFKNVVELDVDQAEEKVEAELSGGKLGVGRYLEPRLVYSSNQFAGDPLEERRTIHLGVDLFADAGTDVVSPWNGTVKVCHTIDKPLDYGTLIILEHQTDTGIPFYTLYGHLDASSAQHLHVGQTVNKGDKLAELGDRNNNGGWLPHLHFQIMLDLLDFENDFPGVAKPSEVDVWSQLCPNPNLILGLPTPLTDYVQANSEELIQRRKSKIGAGLSLGYRKPIHVVRGQAQYLFDASGRRFLDAYNNVPHVGHSHPRVIEAIENQLRLLNTNTRYLHENILRLADRLTATMPEGLDVCYFLNSASEANELAIRLMWAYSGQTDIIVLEGAYHGHTSSLIDISPYKHDGPGGKGGPEWVHTAPVADVYRGEFRDEKTAGKQYADKVDIILERLADHGKGPCGFIAESCPSVGGQILFPPNYLAEVYEKVRRAGGLCVADDVQTGYGRLGKAFYGFELQNVIPDIVVLGKPIGNGHPLAALVTTKEVSDRFDNGMEFFSTFGGNPVSCAAGLAVLEVVEEENLQSSAGEVGDQLLAGMRELKSKHDIVGDVRGSGLFLGMELVRNHDSLEPAAEETSYVSNRMREFGILIGTDGPLHNVLKIRPPMPFDASNATELLERLDRCLTELT